MIEVVKEVTPGSEEPIQSVPGLAILLCYWIFSIPRNRLLATPTYPAKSENPTWRSKRGFVFLMSCKT